MDKLKNSFFMKKALQQAEIAFKKEEIPIGAVVVDRNGNIISRGYNKVERKRCQVVHAEVEAIKKACKKIGDWRLDGCWMFVTLEPCLMCIGLMRLSRLRGVVFGAKSTLFGATINLDKLPIFYRKNFEIIEGVEEDKCLDILKRFFKLARERN